MKQLSFLLTLILAYVVAKAQEITELPKDEMGKFIYYEVVSTTSKEDSLKSRLSAFFAKNKKELKLISSANEKLVSASGKLVIQKSTTLLSHPSGEITYQFNFETGYGKYRFWLTNFKFIPYHKDRYGNFVASTTVGMPLEKKVRKSMADQWEDYRLQVSKYAVNFAKRLKDHLESKAKLPALAPEEKVVSKTW